MHWHKWILTSTTTFQKQMGELDIWRKCSCGETSSVTIFPAQGIYTNDIPISVKDPCVIKHRWKKVRDYVYIIHTSVGDVTCNKAELQKCRRCDNIRIHHT